MSDNVKEAMAALRGLGSVEELRCAAEAGLAPAERPKGNSHIHLPPNFSAFDSVAHAVRLAADEQIGTLGVSNYYNYDVYGDFVSLARKHAIFPLFGLEIISLVDDLVQSGVRINDPGNPGKMYICGKGITKFDEMTPRAEELLNKIRTSDRTRMAEMIVKIAGVFKSHGLDTPLSEDKVIDMVVKRHSCRRDTVYLQERHIAQACQEILFNLIAEGDRAAKLETILGKACKDANNAVGVQGEIRSALMKAGKSCFVTEMFVNFDEACELILQLGGIPCYPTLADGVDPICGFEQPVENLIASMQERNIHCAEYIPLRNRPEVLSQYVKAVRAAGIVVTGGTEHNTLTLDPMEPACVGGAAVPEDIKDIFWEGACVVAAHQFLTLHGECGFVDSNGKPNANYDNADERIASLAKLGAAIIEKYFQTNKA